MIQLVCRPINTQVQIGPKILFFMVKSFQQSNNIIIMKGGSKICHKVTLKTPKDRDPFVKREQSYIEGTPKIILAKLHQNNLQEIWTDDLRNEPVQKLKELNSNAEAFSYARRVIATCGRLALRYGNFMINENMIFFNPQRQLFAWINPDILENQVKIYLPNSPDGHMAMMRGIVTYLKLWLKNDYAVLAEAKQIDQLLFRFDELKNKLPVEFKAKSPERDLLGTRKNSAVFQLDPSFNRYSENSLKLPNTTLLENRSNRDMKSPVKQQEKLILSMSNKQKPLLRHLKDFGDLGEKQRQKNWTAESRNEKTDPVSSDKNAEESEQFEHKSFHNLNASTKAVMNQSLGLKRDKYFPNRTTSKKNHPIVQLISSQDTMPNQYRQNKLLLDESQEEKEREREQQRKMKEESLDGIGEEVNELFFSNIESDDNEEQLKKMEEQFDNLLN